MDYESSCSGCRMGAGSLLKFLHQRKLKLMPEQWKSFAVLAGVVAAGILAVTIPSTSTGRRPADFRTNGVSEIELSMPGFKLEESRITETGLCLSVLEAMRTGRATRPHPCPTMGRITIRYTDGTSNQVTLSPSHGFGRIELGDATGQYALSRAKLFNALKRAKLLPEGY
jgi:hypothetical protein